MICPKDKIACNTKQLEDINIDTCPKCNGVWIEQVEVRHLVRHLSMPKMSYMDELLDKWEVIKNDGTPPDDFWSEDNLTCPKDGTQMKKHYFAGGHIGVDQCHTCKGFWLDGGELHAIAEYVSPNPTVDKAWQLFIRDDIEWRRKMEEVKTLPAQLGMMVLNPKYGLVVIGSFITQTIFDYFQNKGTKY